ncbi:MAG TPA: NAD(P)-dependent oxidoreductase [Solirubrobacterales bacterium]|nr:NAD(P)-dependent oxidoreductase [Solirubrobacterales bacterium]
MRVFVAGASGVIGVPLVRQLVAAGHDVTGTTSKPENAPRIEAAGAAPVVCDALDPQAVQAAVRDAAPEVAISQLTRLPSEYNPRKIDYGPTNRARAEGGHNLIEAARAAGVKRLITQSVAFLYAPEGEMVKDEDARPWADAPEPFRAGADSTLEHEREATNTAGLEGIVLRYGQFYGPGTYYAPDGNIAEQVRRRRFPIVGRGQGMFSFIDTEDAAAATVASLDRGAPGIYNVVDDEPAPLREWLPVYAEALGARRPRRVPTLLARLVAGRFAVAFATELRGASNAKAKRELGWQPRYPSWRQGFRETLG